jgi:hypothetical protein
MEDRTLLSTFVVSNSDDSGPGSLRQAITDSNTDDSGATNTIDFDIPGPGVNEIFLLANLPAISSPVLIDGTSQPGFAGTPLIELNGSQETYSYGSGHLDGLTITGSGITVRGLDIGEFETAGIEFLETGATGDWIYDNFLGTDPTGTLAQPNYYGVLVDGGAGGDLIGTVGTDGQRALAAVPGNVISGNYGMGVELFVTTDNVVAGNDIGTDATGSISLPNAFAGIQIEEESSDNTIGGTTAGAGNLITDNGEPGVVVGNSASDTTVGNQITGNSIFGNGGQAIDLGDDGATGNATNPRTGPNNLQNYPIIVATARGQLQGGLGGSTPDAPFDIEFFASSAYVPGGSGEAEVFLGSLEVTTDDQGQAIFDVPYAPPAGLPIVTATATDPEGNTSEVSAYRPATLESPTQTLRFVPGQPLIFSTASGNGIELQGPDALPFNLTSNLTLSVSAGALLLSTTVGLTGSGDGTGSLSYSGSLRAINAALDGLRYEPPPQSDGVATLSVNAQVYGEPSLQGQILLSDGVFVVTTTADSGVGSLRQAILDSNAVTGGTNTIDFDIPGTGAQTIVPTAPFPLITTSLLLDGTTQRGFAGLPLVVLSSQLTGSQSALAVSAPNVSIIGLAIDRVAIDVSADALLIAVAHTQGARARLSLLDSEGTLLVQSDGLAPGNPDDEIDQHLAAGIYVLTIESASTGGSIALTTNLTPANTPFQPINVPNPAGSEILDERVTTGDFNNDGRLDLAVTTFGSGEVNILLGNGDGTFRPPVPYAVGSTDPFNIVAGDFNGDGRTDLAVANGDGPVSVLLGNGDGTFQPEVSYAAGPGTTAIVAVDLSGNGRLDLAVTNGTGKSMSVLMNKGDGTFGPPVSYPVGVSPYDLVAGDFNGDGHVDLAVADAGGELTGGTDSGELSVLLGNGNGTFRPQVTYAVGAVPLFLLAIDFNGDGHLDLAVADYGNALAGGTDVGSIGVLMGNGDGTFGPVVRYAVGSAPQQMVAGDFNGDGRIDIAVVDVSNYDLSVLLGNGNGTFQQPISSPEGYLPTSLVAGDFNGDGRTDLAVANVSADSTSSVSILLSKGDGTFLEQPNLVGSNPVAIVAGDWNGDGRTDLATANYSNTVSVLLANGDGTFQTAVQYAVGSFPSALLAGDWNGDGREDLAVANTYSNDVSILLGNGDGTFEAQVTYPVGPRPIAIVAGDWNRDGHLDLAVGCFDSSTSQSEIDVLMGNGDGTFQRAIVYAGGFYAFAIVAGDFTGQGRLDLAVASYYNVSVLMGNGDGTFQPAVQYSVEPGATNIVAGDFGDDGHLNLAVSDSAGVQILLGNGDGTFQAATTVADGIGGALAAGDFNADGRLDLAVVNQSSNDVSILLANRDGTFGPTITYAVGSGPDALVAGDFSGSGSVDLAVANGSSYDTSVLLNDGDGTFTDASQLVAVPHATPVVADFNGDGTLDVLELNSEGDVLYRQGIPLAPGSFLPPVTINPGFPSRDIALLTDSAGPVLASVDARDNAISFYDWHGGRLLRISSRTTGQFPAQIVSADLNSDGLNDLVVRNAGDGTLSVFFGAAFNRSTFMGPLDPTLIPPAFLAPVVLPVALGTSDVQAVDTSASGRLDLVLTNKLTGQISILRNLGGGGFAPPANFSAGTGLSAVDAGGTPEVTSLEAPAGVAAGPFTTGGPTDLVAINPGSNTLDILSGLGGGRFANPVTIPSDNSNLQVLRVADFNDDGAPDLALLGSDGVSIYLGNGKEGFAPPVTYSAGTDPTGLTVADLQGNGSLDLLIGNDFGDVLILVDNGDGTFRPYEPVQSAIALAVADLTGNGVPDFVFANQSLNQVSVAYGSGAQNAANRKVIGNQATGVLSPGAVLLTDMNGDGFPDLVVANSGANDILVYPGLGDGQFGPPINGTQGFPVGTDPTGLTVANLNGQPDLLVADTGSNDVLVLLGQGTGSSWTMTRGPRIQTEAGPVATVVGNVLPNNQMGLAVADNGANSVQIFPSVGGGFFNDQASATKTYPVGKAPSGLFMGNFSGGPGLATLNAGSNDGTLITGLGSANLRTQVFPTGGIRPVVGFTGDFGGNGFTDLVVGDNGNGSLALLLGGSDGLSLSQTISSADVPSPTGLSFSGVSGGQLNFFVSTAGREAAFNLAFNLSGGPEAETGVNLGGVTATEGSAAGALSQATTGSVQQVSQLLSLSGTTLDLAATLLTVSVIELESSSDTSTTGASTGPGQGSTRTDENSDDSGEEPSEDAGLGDLISQAIIEVVPAWKRLAIGLSRSWERARTAILELDGRPPIAEDAKATAPPPGAKKLEPPVKAPAQPTTKESTGAQAKPTPLSEAGTLVPFAPEAAATIHRQDDTSRAVDAALADLGADREPDGPLARTGPESWTILRKNQNPGLTPTLVVTVAATALACSGWVPKRRRAQFRLRHVFTWSQEHSKIKANYHKTVF